MHGNDNAVLGAQNAHSGVSGRDWYTDSQTSNDRKGRPLRGQETALMEWTPKMVADRLEEAASTLRRLPVAGLKPREYGNSWPTIIHEFSEAYGWNEAVIRLGPPPADAITRMDETMEWLRWLEPDQVRLVWARAERMPWKAIAPRFACDRIAALALSTRWSFFSDR